MRLKVIGTGSSGNCYAVYESGKILLLDAGLSYKTILRGIDFQIQDVAGCIITHKHMDHAKAIKDLESAGVPCWKAWEDPPVASKLFGPFRVMASFEVPHDGTDNRGFILEAGGQRLLYVTDFEYCPVTFRRWKLNHLLVECNYTPDMLDESEHKYAHVLRGHASLQTVKDFVAANRTSSLRTVTICHMSAGSDIDRMVSEIKQVAGPVAKVFAAIPNLEIRMDNAPF